MDNLIFEVLVSISNLDKDQLVEAIDKPVPWDSFANVEVILALETKFGITFSASNIDNMSTIRDILRLTEDAVLSLGR